MIRFEEAVMDGAKAVELAPDDLNAHYVLGLALVRSGRRDEARREFERAVRFAAINPPMFRRVEEQKILDHALAFPIILPTIFPELMTPGSPAPGCVPAPTK